MTQYMLEKTKACEQAGSFSLKWRHTKKKAHSGLCTWASKQDYLVYLNIMHQIHLIFKHLSIRLEQIDLSNGGAKKGTYFFLIYLFS